MIFIYIKHGKCKALTNSKTCSVLGKFKICSYTNKSSIYYNVPNNLFPSMRFFYSFCKLTIIEPNIFIKIFLIVCLVTMAALMRLFTNVCPYMLIKISFCEKHLLKIQSFRRFLTVCMQKS